MSNEEILINLKEDMKMKALSHCIKSISSLKLASYGIGKISTSSASSIDITSNSTIIDNAFTSSISICICGFSLRYLSKMSPAKRH